MKDHQLSADQLKKTYLPEEFVNHKEAIPAHRQSIIGQDRAERALRFGLGNRSPGFNVYISTSHSEGIYSVIQHFLEEMATKHPESSDWCYVNNFKNPYCPLYIQLRKGVSLSFKRDIESFIIEAKDALIKTFESDEYHENIDSIKDDQNKSLAEFYSQVNQKAKEEGFLLKRTPVEIIAVPIKNGQPLSGEEFNKLPEEEKNAIIKKQDKFQETLRTMVNKSIELNRTTKQRLKDLREKSTLFVIEGLLEKLRHNYRNEEKVLIFIESMKEDILDNLDIFLQEETAGQVLSPLSNHKNVPENRYQVNIIVDNSQLDHAPIVFELNPTFNNLFGKIEKESIMGTLVTNFTLIRSGALHMANGGYLILPIKELLMAPFAWDSFKRAIRNNQIEIEDPTEKLGFISTKSLKPEPIPLQVQVILVGQHYLFQLLHFYDEDFKNLFKVKAHFDSEMLTSRENLREFCGFVNHLQSEEQLLPINEKAMVKIIEHAHRLAGHQEKISSATEKTADLIREANYYAMEESVKEITDAHIMKAIDEKVYRSNLVQEKINEFILKGIILIDLESEKIGQVNGLSVIDLGDIVFGKPNRITSTANIGKDGIIDIERESKLGGNIHSKGVMVLTGYLFNKFGTDKSLSLSIRLVFEQSYGEIDGDSASSAELYAILSSLAGVPIKQSIAVTGSVNQYGQIQAVGGINEKIEGFYEVCKQKTLTGEQGVIIPAANCIHLVLKEEVVNAVDEGKFHIWAINSIDEGIEILTGMNAGKSIWDEEYQTLIFEDDTLFNKVNTRLLKMADVMKEHQSMDTFSDMDV